jgi:hypothetical protein
LVEFEVDYIHNAIDAEDNFDIAKVDFVAGESFAVEIR